MSSMSSTSQLWQTRGRIFFTVLVSFNSGMINPFTLPHLQVKLRGNCQSKIYKLTRKSERVKDLNVVDFVNRQPIFI